MAMLKVHDLDVEYTVGDSVVRAVRNVCFTIDEGRNLGIVGESGCGKTTAAKAVMRLLPRNGRVSRGRVLFEGQDLLQLDDAQMRSLRWQRISTIPQSAMNTLDPVYRVGDQLCESILTHRRIPRSKARERSVELAELVGLEEKRLADYPHQLSGGMKQRFVIAMALSLEPTLIIADEPTTALDVITQDRILSKIRELQERLRFAMIYISHDIGVIAEVCDAMAVMYAGRIVEYGKTRELFADTYHPYTLGLKNAFPSLQADRRLISIPGFPPSLVGTTDEGCMFRPRCPFAIEECGMQVPTMSEVQPGHWVACMRTGDVGLLRDAAQEQATWLESAVV